MWKASATYVMDFDQLFSPFLSGHPWESLFLSVGARALFGLAVGLLSMALLVVLFMIFNRRYATFKAYEETLDPLTGLMTRRAFFQTCARVLREQQPQGGYFLMVDLDHLKEINDTFGHPEGDRVIRQVGQCLKDSFGEQALAARMGGDEFALLLWEPISRQELEVALRPGGAVPGRGPAPLRRQAKRPGPVPHWRTQAVIPKGDRRHLAPVPFVSFYRLAFQLALDARYPPPTPSRKASEI